jgi:hypothetical protein
VVAVFGGSKTVIAVMCVQKKKQDGSVVGAIEIGTKWIGLTQGTDSGTWKMDKDPNDLETVWGGSARKLLPAIRYALGDPSASFPVTSALEWQRDAPMGQLAGNAHGCLVTDIGVVVLADSGDLVIEPGSKDAKPADITSKIGLATKSKFMTPGDFNGDGRMDLASWDGSKVSLALRGGDGKFFAPSEGVSLAECRSLNVVAQGLVSGDRRGLTFLKPHHNGGLVSTRVDAGGELGAGGVATAADFNEDGIPDVLQVFSKGVVFYAGTGSQGELARPVATKLQATKDPRVLVCGDFDTDGKLDVMVGGEGGSALLGIEDGVWSQIIGETGELGAASGLGQGDMTVVGACPSDINGDGRQAVAFFHGAGSPGLFFNRGFSCFGVARTLAFTDLKLPAAESLGGGQAAGILWDVDGDLVPDLFAVDTQRRIWTIFGDGKGAKRVMLTASMPPDAVNPLTVTVSMGQRAIGMYVVRPGEPTQICLPRTGKVSLMWKSLDGKTVSREIVVLAPKRIVLP